MIVYFPEEHPLISLGIAVAAHLALYKFTLKTDPPSAFKPDQKDAIPDHLKFEPISASQEWDAGVIAAKAQNLARTVSFVLQFPPNSRSEFLQLMELPANMLTPTVSIAYIPYTLSY